jgi:NAD(P)-dependent dehydrogenase (short-subunit alcohol dehydrogenase family)
MKLHGRGVVITGASQGLGKAIAAACIANGAQVLLCARGKESLEQAREDLARQARPGQQVLSRATDVGRPEEVKELIAEALRRLGRIDGLVNNAGVYGPIGLVEEVAWEEWVQAIQINLMGSVVPCREVLPIFRKQGRGKIVNISGGGATAPLPRFSAYSAAKAAVVRFTETLAHETLGSGIDVNAVAPGALNTRLLDQVLSAGAQRVGREFYERALEQKGKGGTSPEKGAALCVFLLSEESNGITGRLLSAVWDPWEALSQRRTALQGSDVYTLRRIVPEDRGLDWDEP